MNINFGTVKDIFLDKLIESYTSEDKALVETGKNLYKSFLKTLKENETLKTAFIVYKNIENKTIKNESLANDYLNENLSFLQNFRGESSLKVQTKKLIRLLEDKHFDFKGIKIKEIHKSLDKLINKNKTISNLNLIQESKNEVLMWLVSDKEKINETEGEEFVRENINPKKFLDIAVSKFNEKYKDSLTEEERNILKVLRENNYDTIKSLVSNLVKETVILVNNHLVESGKNITVKEKLLETKDVIYKMTENNSNFSEKVLKLYELKKNLIS